MATSDRRIIQRFPLDFRVDFIHDGDYIISCSKDISMDGMFISTSNPPPVGTHVNLIFSSEGHLDIEVTALVVWIKKSTMYRNPGMGVQFLSSLPKQVKKNILKNIDQVMILGDNNKSA
jgi:uncharacterized protein (TIGR02266 family)